MACLSLDVFSVVSYRGKHAERLLPLLLPLCAELDASAKRSALQPYSSGGCIETFAKPLCMSPIPKV